MKKSFKLFSLILLAAATAFAACTKQPQEKPTDQSKDPTTVSDDPGSSTDPVYADLPFSKVSVTCSGETVDGTLLPDGKTINFRFNKAESFNDATLAVEVNEGYTLTYPTSLEHVDLQAEPVLNFKTPKNATVKFWLTFSSDAFPIVDETKIHLAGEGVDGLLKIDQGSKTFTVTYDRDKLVYESVTLVFEEGALQEGAKVTTELTYNFTKGLSQPLVIDLGGEREYTVTLDVSAYVKYTPADFGFDDETYKYVDNVENYPFLHVYRASSIAKPVPVFHLTNGYPKFNPWEWEFWDENYANGTGHHAYAAAYDDFSFVGDWAEDRPTMSCYGTVAIVTIDREVVKGSIHTDADNTVALGEFSNFIVQPGSVPQWNYMVFEDGELAHYEDPRLWRSAVGFDEDGDISFATSVVKEGVTNQLYKIGNIDHWTDSEEEVNAVLASATEWNVKSAAWGIPWALRDGKAMKCVEIIQNDGSRWVEALGWAWNGFYCCRNLIGITYDNKIAMMVNPGGTDTWSPEFDNHYEPYGSEGIVGYSLPQLVWLARELGWREAFYVSGATGNEGLVPSTVVVNGKSVMTAEDNEVFANESAAVEAAYAITFDLK